MSQLNDMFKLLMSLHRKYGAMLSKECRGRPKIMCKIRKKSFQGMI